MADEPPAGIDLDALFHKSSVFDSSKDLRKKGFKVLREKADKVFVFTHKKASGYLFKMYMPSDDRSYKERIEHYNARVTGARLLKKHIEEHHISRITVPQKWLCQLPSRFETRKGPSYIVIAEFFSVLDEEESRDQYEHIDREQLRELCTILFAFRGLDFTARNAPYLRDGRIVWIDTEHIKTIKPKLKSREKSYDKNIERMLSGKKLRSAEHLWDKLAKESGLDKKKKRG